MDISILIVSWNVADVLATCLESIQRASAGLQVEVIVVDSASTDNSVAMIRERFPWVHLIVSAENIGFVRGNNLAWRQASGRYIFMLNPDTELLDNVLTRLVAILDANPSVGIVGPHTLNTDGTHQSTRRRFPTLLTGIFESTWLEHLAPTRFIQDFKVMDQPDAGTYAVDWVQGSALLARRTVWEQIGALDERYIMFAEEMDWSKRAKDAGWAVWYVGDARIIHYGGQSTTQVKARSHVHFQHSKLRYFRKHHGFWQALLLRVVLMLNYGWQIALEGGKWLLGHKRPLRAERVAAYWTVFRSLGWAGEAIVMPKTTGVT